MLSDRWRLRERWGRVSTPTRLALLVIGVHMVVRTWQILPAAYWQDDFAFLRAGREGFPTLDTLVNSPNGHLIPGSYLVAWVLAQFPGSFLPAALLLLGLQLIASLTLWLLLRAVVGDRMSLVLGLSLALFTPLMFSTVSWWAAGLVMLVQQIVYCVAGYCHVRFLRSRSWWWVIGGVAAMVVGLLFIEKTLLLPLFLVLLTVLMSTQGFRGTVVLLLRQWLVWLVYAVVASGYLVAYLRLANLGDGNAQSVAQGLELVRYQLVDVFARGLIGGPWGTVLPGTGQWLPISVFGLSVLLQILAAVAVLAHRVSGSRSLVAWAVLASYLAANLALTVRGRGLFAGYVELDPRYVCDVIPVAALCVAVMFTPRPGVSPRLAPWFTGRSVPIVFATVVLLFNSSMVTAGHIVAPLHHREVTDYVENARGSLTGQPGLVLYDGFVPATIMIGAFPEEEKRVSSILAAYDVVARYNRPSESMRVLDDTGVARPITLAFPQTGEIEADNDCGVSVEPGQAESVEMDAPIPTGTWVLRLEYYTASDTVVEVTTAGDGQPVGLRAGDGSVLMTVTGGTSSVEVASVQGDAAVCVTGVAVGFPVPNTS